MSKEIIAQLRAELTGLTGPARLPGLVRLGQALMGEYTRIGPGTPDAEADLDASIDALDEAYGYLASDDPVRGQVAALLGTQFAARYGAHGGATRDCETGIHVLEEALSFPDLPPAPRAMSRLSLGQLYLGRVSAYMQSSGFGMQARSGGTASAQAVADVDRAAACFHAVIDGEPVSDEHTNVARTLLDMVEAVRGLLGAVSGDLSRFDINSLGSAFAVLQKMQDQMRRGGQPGYRVPPTVFFSPGAESITTLDPLDRPVAVVQGRPVVPPPVPTIERPAPPAPPDVDELRRSLYGLLPLRADGPPDAVWLSASDLLRLDTPMPDVATVDEMVALASTVVARHVDSDRASAAIDSYVLAVALLVRDRINDGADRLAAAEELLSAARAVPLDHPAAIVILRSLGAFLSDTKPLDGVLGAIAGGYADRLDSAIAAGVREPADLVTLHALRCICRAAEALAELRRATGPVPPEYPWSSPIRAAGQLAQSATG